MISPTLRFETKDSRRNNAPIWQLTGKPITTDHARHREYLSIIRGERYLVGLHFLDIKKRFVDCAGCKSDNHPAHMCPFPKTEDWMGPTPDNAERFLKSSVAEVRFSSVLDPFFENQELNRWPGRRTEPEPEPNRQNRFCLFSSVPEPVRTGEPQQKI